MTTQIRLLTLLLVLPMGFAAMAGRPDPASIATVDDDPALPRVLLIGDSISIGYTLAVREALAGEANVHRIPTNGGPTIRGLEYIDRWIGNGDWEVIHFNWGLHDMKRVNAQGKDDPTAEPQVPLEKYRENLEHLVKRLEQTGAALIWASTTTVPETELRRRAEDQQRYNDAAAEIMQAHGIPTDDLAVVSREQCAEHHEGPGNVHYTDEGSAILGKAVAASIREAIARRTGEQ